MPNPDLSKRIVYAVPSMNDVVVRRDIAYRQDGSTQLLMDVYSPRIAEPERRLPALFFVHGGPIPSDMLSPKEWGIFQSYGALAAASGCIGVTFQHRLFSPTAYPVAETDVVQAIDFVRSRAGEFGVDRDQVGLWAFSGGGPLLSWALRERPAYVRCLLGFYALLDLRHLVPPNADAATIDVANAMSPAAHLQAQGPRIPLYVARAGRDSEMINQSVDRFVREAIAANMDIDFANHAGGEHAFDARNDDERSREIVQEAIEFVRANMCTSNHR